MFCKQSLAYSKHVGRAGLTILEVLIALVITAILFSAIFYGINMGFNMLQTTRENLRATQVALSRMEGLRLCAWDPVSTNSTYQLFNTTIIPRTFTNSFYPLGIGSINNQGATYYGTMTVVTNSAANNIFSGSLPSYSNQMALITVTINWTNKFEGSINAHTRVFKTYVSQYGVQNYIYADQD